MEDPDVTRRAFRRREYADPAADMRSWLRAAHASKHPCHGSVSQALQRFCEERTGIAYVLPGRP